MQTQPLCRRVKPAMLAAAAVAALAGCQDYTATVRNEAAFTVVAELVTESLATSPVTASTAVIEPGREATLGPAKSEILDPVRLNVRRTGDPHAIPISRRLEHARSVWVVENGGLQTWDGFSLRLLESTDDDG